MSEPAATEAFKRLVGLIGTQEQAAFVLGVSKGTFYRLVQGRKPVTDEVAADLITLAQDHIREVQRAIDELVAVDMPD